MSHAAAYDRIPEDTPVYVISVAAELAGFSSDLEVLAPATVREALVSIGRELVARYGE